MDGAAGSTRSTRWFTDDETRGLDPKLVEMLDHARGLAKVPFYITSGLRTPDSNAAAGGVEDSSHTRGLGVDLACSSSVARMRIVSSLLIVGFRRIGIYDRHIHCDIDESLPQGVMWWGKSK